jgi:chromate transporter
MNTVKYRLWLRLFWIFFKAGAFTFAGGLAMLPLIQKDVTERYQLLDEETFLDYAALSQTIPGIISLNCAVFVGKSVGGVSGAVMAGLGTVVPAFALMLLATIFLFAIPRDNALIAGAFGGVRSASAALILYSAVKLGRRDLRQHFSQVIIGAALILALCFQVKALPLILGGAACGVAAAWRRKRPETGGAP